MNGVLVVDKPAGPTSHDVVARVRRATGVLRIGHTGTLDPAATGVLPLVVGRATRLAQYLSGAVKEYDAAIRFGASTETYDADSVMSAPPEPPGLDADRIREALVHFTGTFFQSPPPFSAKKVGGIPAYKLARRHKPVAIRPVEVTVYTLRLTAYDRGVARVHVTCSAGFYVRSLAHDVGGYLGCGAYLEALRRTKSGDFSEEQAIHLAELERSGPDCLTQLVPMQSLLPFLPPVVVNEQGARRAAHGNTLAPADVTRGGTPAPGAQVRLFDTQGTLLGIAEPTDSGLLHPVVVLV